MTRNIRDIFDIADSNDGSLLVTNLVFTNINKGNYLMNKNFLLISVVLLLSACASAPIELNRETFEVKKIDSVVLLNDVGVISHQASDAGVSSGAAGAGLLGALVGAAIDSGVNSKRAKGMEPVLYALGGYDPNVYLRSSLKNEAAGIAFQAPIAVLSGGEDNEETLPSLGSSYTVQPDFSGVVVTLSVLHDQFGEESKPYTNLYSSYQVTGAGADSAENRQVWIDSPQILVDTIEDGITEVVQKFVADYNGTNFVGGERAPGDYPIYDLPGAKEQTHVPEIVEAEIPTSHPGLVAQLSSPATMTMRTAAKLIGERKIYDDAGINAATIEVLNKYLEVGVGAKDKFLIDGLSWCALNLGNTNSSDSREMLAKIVASDLPKKLRSHAIHALKIMNGEV